MNSIKYFIKDIDASAPLRDTKNNTVGILVDGNFTEIPTDVFNLLFKECPDFIPSIDIQYKVKDEIEHIKKNYPKMIESIKDMEKSGVSMEEMIDAMRVFSEADPEVKDKDKKNYTFFASELIREILTKKE